MKEAEGYLKIKINNYYLKDAYELLNSYAKKLKNAYFDWNLEYFQLNNKAKETENNINKYLKENKKYKSIIFTVYYLTSSKSFIKWKKLIETDFKIIDNQESSEGIPMKTISADELFQNNNDDSYLDDVEKELKNQMPEESTGLTAFFNFIKNNGG